MTIMMVNNMNIRDKEGITFHFRICFFLEWNVLFLFHRNDVDVDASRPLPSFPLLLLCFPCTSSSCPPERISSILCLTLLSRCLFRQIKCKWERTRMSGEILVILFSLYLSIYFLVLLACQVTFSLTTLVSCHFVIIFFRENMELRQEKQQLLLRNLLRIKHVLYWINHHQVSFDYPGQDWKLDAYFFCHR